ncbi:YdaS family helix-turn-helix protein [Sphingomonas sp. PP-CE-1G-424]|uniref:transcriptional regulator n=1 Tax=Sphingomonas sp. PP-CE-1G-424 TaxID=2135658 RepID=UPI0010569CFE|nr:YdaS family helix-turn-helix protein [Sphingomonas sp. PP-CE-1G-424]TCP65893.1 YdaS antitoxin of YdaST toxin-antitoxin system [Sphingomonas sp. PP-CE-1G-424]
MGIEANLGTPLAEAVRKVGSQSAFARLVGKSQTSVYGLLRDNKPLWAESVLAVEAATGVSKEQLRPDIYRLAGDVSHQTVPANLRPVR